MRTTRIFITFIALFNCIIGPTVANEASTKTKSLIGAQRSRWKLLWKDDFNGRTLNSNKWGYQLYDGCQYGICNWGNGELSWYTNHTKNVRVSNGSLVLEARVESGGRAAAVHESCWNDCRSRCRRLNLNGPSYDGCINDCGNGRCQNVKFTSGRVRTFGKFSIAPSTTYKTIRIESRMKLPKGNGLWPAFWMLPESSSRRCSGCGTYGQWPASGELDIVESSNDMSTINGTVHFGGGSNHQYITGGTALSSGWHTFSIEWEQNEIRWYLDGKLYNRVRSGASLPPGTQGWFTTSPKARSLSGAHAPFGAGDKFYIIINLAVGGSYTSTAPEVVAQTLSEPKRLLVDWVRVLGR